jgi:hypothetical protein
MLYKVSQGVKTFIDFGLLVVGGSTALFVDSVSHLPPPYNYFAPVVGAGVGYLISDLTTFVDKGSSSSSSAVSGVKTQLVNLYELAKPNISAALTSKIPPEEQPTAQSVIQIIEAEIEKTIISAAGK